MIEQKYHSIGIIGFGARGQLLAETIGSELPEYGRVAAIADNRENLLYRQGVGIYCHNFKVYRDYRDLLADDEIAKILTVADDLSKWASDIYSFAQDQAITHGKQWEGFKLVEGRSNRKYTSDAEVIEAAKAAGYTDIYKKSLIGVSEMERLMGKKEFSRILGRLVYKPEGKVTLVPNSDKREAINRTTAAADFQEV